MGCDQAVGAEVEGEWESEADVYSCWWGRHWRSVERSIRLPNQ